MPKETILTIEAANLIVLFPNNWRNGHLVG